MNKMDKGMSGESIFRSIVENQADLICRFEPDGKLLYANRSFAEYINCHQDELVGKNLFDELDPGMRQVFLNATHALDLTHPVQSSEYSEESACKEKAWRQWNHKGIFGENGKLIEIQSVGHNITEQKRLEIAAAQRNIELHALHKATTVLLSTIDLEILLGHILDAVISAIPAAQKGALYLVARDTGQLIQRAVLDHTHTDPRIRSLTLPGSTSYVRKAVGERKPFLYHNFQPDVPAGESDTTTIQAVIVAPLILQNIVLGALSLESTTAGAFTEEDLRLLVSFAATATAAINNAQLHAEVQLLAITDSLTGLLNRRGFYELGQREIERARRYDRPLSAIMLDVDFFKLVNDNYGHAAGDHALWMIASLCKSRIRKIDVICRYGGDEFAILLPETNEQIAATVAERLRSNIAELPLLFEERTFHLTISLGVSYVSGQLANLGELLKHADAGLYAAKEAGRNRIEVYRPIGEGQ